MLRQMQEADPDPVDYGSAPPALGGRPKPAPVDPALRKWFDQYPSPLRMHRDGADTIPTQMTEEEMLRLLQESDPPPNVGPRNYGLHEVPWYAGTNFTQNGRQFFDGMVHTLTHPQETGEALGRLIAGGGAKLATPEVQAMMVKENPNLQAKLDSVDAVAKHYQDSYGGWENIKRTMAERPVEFLADASTFVPGVNALNPTRVLNPLTRGTGRAVRGISNALDFQGNLLLGATEGMDSQILNQLRNPGNTLVPGSTPTAAQAVATMDGVPTRFQALGQAADARMSTLFNNARAQNNDARIADVGQVSTNHNITQDQINRAGGAVDPTTATIEELEAAIRAADATNYGHLNARMIQTDQDVFDLFNRPSGDLVMRLARDIALEEGRPFNVGNYVPATPSTTVPSGLLDAQGRPIMTTVPGTPAQFPQFRGDDLITIKQAYNRLLSSDKLKADNAIDSKAAAKIQATLDEYTRWMEDPSRLPEHVVASADHADWSRLRDRRVARDVFLDALTGPRGENALHQQFTTLSNLMDSPRNVVQGNKALRKATSFDYDSWAELLTPEDIEILTRNLDDMSRIGLAKDQARLANQHSNDIDNASPTPRFPSLLKAPLTVTNALLDRLTSHGNNLVSRRTSNALLTPEGAAEILEAAINRRDFRNNESAQAWRNLDESIQLMNRVPAGYNAFNAEREGSGVPRENATLGIRAISEWLRQGGQQNNSLR